MTPVCAAKNLIAEEKHWLLVKLANLNSTLAIGEKGDFCYIKLYYVHKHIQSKS